MLQNQEMPQNLAENSENDKYILNIVQNQRVAQNETKYFDNDEFLRFSKVKII